MKQEISAKQTFFYILENIKPFPLGIFVMVLLSFIWAIDLSARPYLLKIMLNRLTETEYQDVFLNLALPAVLYLFMSFLFATALRLHGYFVEIKMIPCLRANIANNSFSYLLEKTQSYYQENFSGNLVNKINDLVQGIPEIIQTMITRFFSNVLALSIAIYTLWQVNVQFALAMLCWTTFFVIGSYFASKPLSRLADDWSENGSIVTGKMVDALSNILSIRLFVGKNIEKQTLDKSFHNFVKSEQKLSWAYFWIWFFYGYSFIIILGLNIYLLLKGRYEGWITIGDFVLVLTINITIVEFLSELAREFSQFSKLFGKISQALKAVLDIPEIQDRHNARQLKVTKGEIIFEQVKFQYNEAKILFDNKSVVIHPGEKVGLVGYSGGGKTTFANLILRLYDIHDGRILIDGQDIREVTQESLWNVIGMIPQDPSLFNRTLMENIRYGRANASDTEVFETARRAHAHEFISKLPDGYNSLVGERGVKLSGGQRQRIAIARAFLKNAPILILDEATSQLDSITEKNIQQSLWELMQNKTTIIIAHRLSTLLNMDRILVFDKGKIVEDGSHQELIVTGGLYKKLWDAQVSLTKGVVTI